MQQNNRCRLFGERSGMMNHIISEWSKLAQKEYKTRHNWAGKMIYWELRKKFKFDHMNKWYTHNPESVLKNETQKILWDFKIQTDHLISARWPDLVTVNKKENHRPCYPPLKLRIVLISTTNDSSNGSTVLFIHWCYFVTNIKFHEKVNIISIEIMLMKFLLRRPRIILCGKLYFCHRDRGAPKKRFKDCLTKSFGAYHIDYPRSSILAENRDVWRLTTNHSEVRSQEKKKALVEKQQHDAFKSRSNY